MQKKIVMLVMVILAMSASYVSAASGEIEYDISSQSIRKLDPLPDGTQQYTFKIAVGSHRTPGGNQVTNYIYAHTNADTQGLDLLADGSSDYPILIVKDGDGKRGYLVKNIDSANSLHKRQEANLREKAEKMAAQQCTKVRGEMYFCFDDNNKLKGHDIVAVSKLLKDATARLLQAKANSLHLSDLDGQWYIESTTENSINVTITGAKATDLIGETVIDKKKRAGQNFYFERNAAAITVN